MHNIYFYLHVAHQIYFNQLFYKNIKIYTANKTFMCWIVTLKGFITSFEIYRIHYTLINSILAETITNYSYKHTVFYLIRLEV